MKKIEFGTQAALSGTTPKAIKWIYRALMILSGIWMLVSANYPEIPEHLQLEIAKAIALGNSAVYFICQSFGYVETSDIKG